MSAAPATLDVDNYCSACSAPLDGGACPACLADALNEDGRAHSYACRCADCLRAAEEEIWP